MRRAGALTPCWLKAFEGFSNEEMGIPDGVVLERGTKR
jgi:hypothetical protein